MSTKPKTTKRTQRPSRVYWMRVEIEPDYHWPDELMVDASDEVASITHVIRAQHMTNETMMSLIEGALQAEIAEENEPLTNTADRSVSPCEKTKGTKR